ncbi:Gfo/Idh/MocA family oxidoreductase, partial [Candidatus Sumerlaeota bacterium]|nr:Gfo/Idh/MocA family oxidoreductase [Candidatus Sumerlaeota bacterium]
MDKPNRRDFIKGSTAAALTAMTTACVTMPTGKVIGANERIGMGLIGCGNRGRSVATNFKKGDRVEFLAVCDVFDERRAQAKKALNSGAQEFGDHRKLLELPGIDAVYIATPDHWHAQIAMDALNAGKHVYVEKPLTYKIEEGIGIIKAARNNDRVCQVGMQQRSGQPYMDAKAQFIDSGAIGKITLARTWWHGNSFHLIKPPPGPKPEGLDWKTFVGPRPWRDWNAHQYYSF